MRADEFIQILRRIATEHRTLYVYGGIGGHLRKDNFERYLKSYAYNRRTEREKKIRESLDQKVFGFDCVCLIKSVLWGWNGSLSAAYGGAVYKSNGVPDVNADKMLDYCTEVSSDFEGILPGEFLWMKGHCGIYVGDGLAVECTPSFADGVQITAVANIPSSPKGYNKREWTKHGRLCFVEYPEPEEEAPITEEKVKEDEKQILKDILHQLQTISELLHSAL